MVPGGFMGDLRSPHCISDNLEVVQAENGILRLADSIFLHDLWPPQLVSLRRSQAESGEQDGGLGDSLQGGGGAQRGAATGKIEHGRSLVWREKLP